MSIRITPDLPEDKLTYCWKPTSQMGSRAALFFGVDYHLFLERDLRNKDDIVDRCRNGYGVDCNSIEREFDSHPVLHMPR